jgi:ParB family chromosome partitioning protein
LNDAAFKSKPLRQNGKECPSVHAVEEDLEDTVDRDQPCNVARLDKQRKAWVATFERIIEQAPASFNTAQMRVFLRLLIHLDYSVLDEVASHFANDDENTQQSDDEIVLAALDGTPDEKLNGLALRLVLSDHVGIPYESQPDLLTEAEQAFAPKKARRLRQRPTQRASRNYER